MAIDLIVNGLRVSVAAEPATPLLDVLRNELDLKGTRYGCGLEQCGTCMVLVNGKAAYSCAREVGSVAEHEIITIEGLGSPTRLHPLQQAFLDEQAGQCGYCLSGIIISAKALLDRTPSPSRAEIVAALDKHLCRCGTHTRIIAAIERAVRFGLPPTGASAERGSTAGAPAPATSSNGTRSNGTGASGTGASGTGASATGATGARP